MGWKDRIKEYVPTHTVKTLVRHTVSVGFALLCFWLTAELAKRLFPSGYLHDAIGTLEGVGLIILMGWLFVEMFRELKKGGHNGSQHSLLVA